MRKLLLLLAACGDPGPTGPVKTSQIEADIALEAFGDGELDVTVLLSHGGEPYALEGEDELVAILDGTVFTLIFDRFDEVPTYTTTFFEAPVDENVYIGFNRTTQKDAVGSHVSLPAELTVTAPASASRSEDLVIAWSPGGYDEPIEIALVGPCVDHTAVVDDEGSYVVPAGTLGGSGACDAELHVARVREGTLDSALAGGAIFARQRRIATIAVAP